EPRLLVEEPGLLAEEPRWLASEGRMSLAPVAAEAAVVASAEPAGRHADVVAQDPREAGSVRAEGQERRVRRDDGRILLSVRPEKASRPDARGGVERTAEDHGGHAGVGIEPGRPVDGPTVPADLGAGRYALLQGDPEHIPTRRHPVASSGKVVLAQLGDRVAKEPGPRDVEGPVCAARRRAAEQGECGGKGDRRQAAGTRGH